MRFHQFVLAAGAIIVAGLAAAAQAQVSAKLVAAESSVQPGRSLTVALRLGHEPSWHTYWLNPGIGEATSVRWRLPDSWEAGAIDWPTPIRIRGADGRVTGQGYEGVVYLPMIVTPPKNAVVGEHVRLKAAVQWLMCTTETCVPGGDDVELTLPVMAGAPLPDAAVRAALASMPMPRDPPPASGVTAHRTAERVTLEITGVGGIYSPHFFSATELIAYDGAQTQESAGPGLVLTLPVDPYFEDEPSELIGVLAYRNASGAYAGLRIEVPFSSTDAPAVGSGTVAPDAAAPDAAEVVHPDAGSTSLLHALGLAILGGLILNLMPCVLPVLSLKALSLTHTVRTGSEARRQGLLYTTGVLVSFAAGAVTLIGMTAAAKGVGWGFHLQNPFVVFALAVVMSAVGFNLLGVFELGTRWAGSGQSLTQGAGGRAAFFTGVLAVVVATPCTAPFMATALGYALLQPPTAALAVFMALGLGFAAPMLLISLYPPVQRWLPRPGAWLVTFRQALAFPMFLTTAWLLWVLGAQRGVDGMALGVLAITCMGVLAWALGKIAIVPRPFIWHAVIGMSVLALLGCWIAIGWTAPARAHSNVTLEPSGALGTARPVQEVAYSAELLQQLLAEGRAVFVYFTADWCVTCKVNERVAIRRRATEQLFAAHDVTVMVGDWTGGNAAITKMLASYGRAGVPLYLYFPPGASLAQARLLPQILTPDILRSSIEPF